MKEKVTENQRTCTYFAGQMCIQPHLSCSVCPMRLNGKDIPLEKSGFVEQIKRRLPDVLPYFRSEGPMGEPAIEIGIKGTF